MRAAAEDFKPFAVTWLLGEGLELSRVHWLRPEVVVEVAFSTWTADGLIKQASYQCPRQDRPARPGDRGTAALTKQLKHLLERLNSAWTL